MGFCLLVVVQKDAPTKMRLWFQNWAETQRTDLTRDLKTSVGLIHSRVHARLVPNGLVVLAGVMEHLPPLQIG